MNKSRVSGIYIFLILVSVFYVNLFSQDRAGDSLALVDLYDSCNGEFWEKKNNWKTDNPINTWQGVIIDTTIDRVSTLLMVGKGVQGNIPLSFGNLDELKVLFARNNEIISLPESFGKLNKLERAIFTNNQLTALPDSISYLDSLYVLNIDSNNVEYLPDSFGNLTNLSEFYAKNNSIDTLPNSFANLTSLKKIDLDNNSLLKLPENIGELDSIVHFTAQINNITNFPTSLGNQPTLQYLFLNNNNITILPSTLSGMDSIKTILLIDNQIEEILPSTFSNVTSLERLDLRGNLLTSLPSEMSTLSNLNHFDIGNNQFIDIPEVLFNFPVLSKLYIDYNGFMFDDLEYMHSATIASVVFSPQDSIGAIEHIYSFSGRLLTISKPTIGSQNVYSWYHNGTAIDTNNETPTLHFDSLLLEQDGFYNCHVESDSVSGIKLLQRPTYIHVLRDLEFTADSLPHAVRLHWINPEFSQFGRYIISANDSILDTLNYDTITEYSVEGLNYNEEILFTITIENTDGSISLKDSTGGVLLNATPVIDSTVLQSIVEDSSLILDLSMFHITDPDDSVFSIQIGNGDNYSFSGNEIIPYENFNGSIQVNVRVNDGNVYSSSAILLVEVDPVNDAPFVKYPIPDTTLKMLEGTPFYFPFPDSIFDDIDIIDSVLELTSEQSNGTPLPLWLTFGAGYFSGNPVFEGDGLYEISVKATDSEGEVAEILFGLKVDPKVTITPMQTVDGSNKFLCYPNPVKLEHQKINFQFEPSSIDRATISICTPLGTVLDRIDCSLKETLNYSWDLKNSNGVYVGNGTYIILLEAEDSEGNKYVQKRSFGVQR